MTWFNFGKKPFAIKARAGTIDRVNGKYEINLNDKPICINFNFDLKAKEQLYKEFFGKEADKYELYNKHFPTKNPSEEVKDPNQETEKTITPKNYREKRSRLEKVDEYYSKLLDDELISEIRKREITLVLK